MTSTLSPFPTPSPLFSPPPRQRPLPLPLPLPLRSIPTTVPTATKTGAIIIGAGLAGLAAATRLNAADTPFILLEASDAVGGRVRTDVVDGFLLDRGFQIFITAYPEAQKLLDYKSLDLQKFYSGARVYFNGQFHTVADPLRHFPDAVQSLSNPIGSVLDKLLIGLTRIRASNRSDDEILRASEKPIIDLLRDTGFSDSMIDRFFRPFFGGIFFDSELKTTSRLFDFIFKCLAMGDNTLPSNGIAAIPNQLASKLPIDSIALNSRVVSISTDDVDSSRHAQIVRLGTGETLESELGIIIAVEQHEAAKLLAEPGREPAKPNPVRARPGRGTACLYFEANRAPVREPVLFLNGSGRGVVNNMFFATNVARTYGPDGRTLVSVSVVGKCEGVSDEELRGRWVGFAQPDQCPPSDLVRDPRVRDGVYVCGDHWSSATFDGALVSGRRAAEALLKDKAVLLGSL
ncbi:hypothetical protein Sjap_018843 [Stephania japonica]|uniref:Amine oxidase domain-containing protein n=1 Tax=Stephania japonica TaxID=461633 RepID=A0AAP0NL00_9MAGN